MLLLKFLGEYPLMAVFDRCLQELRQNMRYRAILPYLLNEAPFLKGLLASCSDILTEHRV